MIAICSAKDHDLQVRDLAGREKVVVGLSY